MGKSFRCWRAVCLSLLVSGLSACYQVDAPSPIFSVEAQPAAQGLNEFARQADITLVFSYDTVSGVRTRAVKGRLGVDAGLQQLLAGTQLQSRALGEGSYYVCHRDACGAGDAPQAPVRQDGSQSK